MHSWALLSKMEIPEMNHTAHLPTIANEVWKEEVEDEWDEFHPRRLIPELCQQFYHLGW